MNTQYGWVGKILKVDLSTEKILEIETQKYQNFIGGVGIAAKIFFDEVSPDVGPLDPENQLAFMTGPLTGTMIPGSGRGELCSRSPTPYPKHAWTYSGFGGGWPAELKFAGYDGIVLHGASPCPVYLWIDDGNVELRDATSYWDMDTYQAQEYIRKELGGDPKIRMAVIGPAGKN